jgi:hypothetical protein
MGKKWYESKTVWSAVAAGVVAFAGVLYGEASSIVGILVGVFSALGVYGRVVARENIE